MVLCELWPALLPDTCAHLGHAKTVVLRFLPYRLDAARNVQELASAELPTLLVDGYNVIWASKRLARLARARSLDLARERLVNEVQTLIPNSKSLGDSAVHRDMHFHA